MDTVRNFAEEILPETASKGNKFWSKPDPLHSTIELRRLQSDHKYTTDLFEYYWAHHVRGTKIPHLLNWYWNLITRKKENIPNCLLTLYRLSQFLTLVLIGLAIFLSINFGTSWEPYNSLSFGSIVLTPLLLIIQGFIVNYLGDAARYLSSRPENISLRRKIRSEGLKILRYLHKSHRNYDRIIVVGHSLGSVIGYDLIKLLWHEYHDKHERPKRMKQPFIKTISELGEKLKQDKQVTLEKYREGQLNLWHEQIKASNPWRISDFITLGSPLAHAMLLMAKSKKDFKRRQKQRELPTCPPVLDDNTYEYVKNPPYEVDGKKISMRVLHHAAPFAVTRWTNLYIPATYGIFGDFVGGPLKQVFGKGIRDVPVTITGPQKNSILAHTHYWKNSSLNSDNNEADKHSDQDLPIAIDTLKDILDLEGLSKFVP